MTEKGPEELLFSTQEFLAAVKANGQVNEEVERMATSNANAEPNACQVHGLVDIDDENLPALENIPKGSSSSALSPWGCDGTLFWAEAGCSIVQCAAAMCAITHHHSGHSNTF